MERGATYLWDPTERIEDCHSETIGLIFLMAENDLLTEKVAAITGEAPRSRIEGSLLAIKLGVKLSSAELESIRDKLVEEAPEFAEPIRAYYDVFVIPTLEDD